MTDFEAATLIHVMANTFGVVHSVSVYVPKPPKLAIVLSLFDDADSGPVAAVRQA